MYPFLKLSNWLEKISSVIPIERLMWVKNQRDRSYFNIGELDFNELSLETLALLKHVLGDLINMS